MLSLLKQRHLSLISFALKQKKQRKMVVCDLTPAPLLEGEGGENQRGEIQIFIHL